MGKKWSKTAIEKLKETSVRRVERIKKELEAEGDFVLLNTEFNVGIDMIVILKERKIKAIEITNYAERDSLGQLEYIPDEKVERYRNSLNKFDKLKALGYDVEKKLIISYNTNLSSSNWNKLTKDNIKVEVLGFQD